MSLPALEFHLVNAFTTGSPHSGNQAAVVIFPASDPRAADDAFLLATAQDFGFSETAYLVPRGDRWGLRWFTEEVEVPICGHATLAAAAVLFNLHPIHEAVFETKFWGELRATRCASDQVTISLSTLSASALHNFVATSARNKEELGPVVAKGLGITEEDIIAIGEFEYVEKSLIVEIRPEVDMSAIKADLRALAQPSPAMTIVTQMCPDESSPGILRTNTRVFWLGVMEDPVTGSAHAFITGYYLLTPAAKRLPPRVLQGHAPETINLDARQLSPRGGRLRCALRGDMVDIAGTAIEWGSGTLRV